jgi:hypothetical protein
MTIHKATHDRIPIHFISIENVHRRRKSFRLRSPLPFIYDIECRISTLWYDLQVYFPCPMYSRALIQFQVYVSCDL